MPTDARITDVRQLHGRNARLTELRPHWIRARELLARLDAVPEVLGFPERGRERLDELITESDRLNELLAEGDLSDEMRQQEITNLSVADAFVEHEAEITRVLQQIGYYAEAAPDILKKEAEEREAARSVERARAEFGPGWSEQRLRKFKDAPGVAARLQESGEAESRTRGAYNEAVAEAERRKDELQRAEEEALRERNRLDALPDIPAQSGEVLAARRDRLDRIHAALAELGDLERLVVGPSARPPLGAARAGRPWIITAVLGLAGALVVGARLRTGAVLMAASAAGGLLLALSFYIVGAVLLVAAVAMALRSSADEA